MKPPKPDAELVMAALNELWSTNEMVLGKLHARDHLIDIIEAARADAWDEGHKVGQEYEREGETTEGGETGAHAYHYAIDTNPYRAVKP